MNWNKWLIKLGIAGSTAALSITGILLAVLITALAQLISQAEFQLINYILALFIPFLLITPLAYLFTIMLFQIEEADINLSRKEAQIDYLKRVVSERDGSEKDQLIRDLNSFAQTVAHDLKNPLTSILGFASMLADHQAKLPPEQQKEALLTIVRTSLKMNNIIQELLLLAAVRQSSVKTGPIQMTGIISQVKQRLQSAINDNNVELIIPDTNTWPKVIGYAAWIEEVWINYIGNAIKYGGSPAKVELGLDKDYQKSASGRPMARFWVHDNGKGLSPEEQKQLFIQFTRLDQVRAEGHGLGLSIVARVIEKLGGEVSVESQPNQGSTFFFTLPMLMVEPPTRARPQLLPKNKK